MAEKLQVIDKWMGEILTELVKPGNIRRVMAHDAVVRHENYQGVIRDT